MPAHERLATILRTNQVLDCALPHFNKVRDAPDPGQVRAVCFTQMITQSMPDHADRYSPWGIAFYKSFLRNTAFSNEVLYLRPELFDEHVRMANGSHRLLRYYTLHKAPYDEPFNGEKPIDYTNEREVRTVGPVRFAWENIAMVYVPRIDIFRKMYPDLAKELEAQHVRIEQTPLHTRRLCRHGYDCNWGPICIGTEKESFNAGQGHTEDEKAFFEWREEHEPETCHWLKHKTKICFDWQKGNCTRGRKCSFAHGEADMKPA